MDIKEHTTPEQLERYAFVWSLARLVIAAVSLFFGAMPIAYKLGISYGLLSVFWLVSGIAAIYLLYVWHQNDRSLFGRDNQLDKWLFLIMAITGINLGLVTVTDSNIGFSIAWNLGPTMAMLLMKATALLYLFVAYHLWHTWKANGESLFTETPTPVKGPTATPH
ncbi:hypothetical protein H6778_01575 [Candidatus Nomurabacteria bacterium]|nr:hypothetical protein [Candidatus Nomurabacteria bacterium]